jgi:hypothetical protein
MIGAAVVVFGADVILVVGTVPAGDAGEVAGETPE